MYAAYSQKGAGDIMRTETEMEDVMARYSDFLYRLALTMVHSDADACDMTAEVMVQYLLSDKAFANEEHRRAWLVTVLRNRSRNLLRYHRRHQTTELSDNIPQRQSGYGREEAAILARIRPLPEKYRTILYLYYAEGYSIREIAEMLSVTQACAEKRLQRAREKCAAIWKNEEGSERVCIRES